jgi:predicted PurR-regulated permease PerM
MKVSLGGVLLLGSVVVALLLLNVLSPMMTPFFLGALLAYLGDPWVDRLERWRIGRGLASGLVFLAIALLVAVTLMLFIPALAHEASELLKGLPATLVWLQARLAPLLTPWIGVDAGGMDVRGLAEEYLGDWEQSSDVLGYLLGQLTASGKAIFGGVMTLALTPVVAFYLMRDWDSIIERLDNLIPRSQLVVIRSLVRAGDDMLAAFIRGQLLVMIFLGLFYSIGLGLLGVEMALIIGLVAGLASVVPYLGFILGLALASLTAAYQFQDWLHPAYVLGIFLVGQILEGSVLTPWLVGDKIGLHPVAVIFAVLAGGQLFGFSGVLLALPVTAVLMVLVRFSLQQYLQSQWYQGSAESSSVTVDEPAESEPQALTTPGSEASEAKEEGAVTGLESNPAIDGRGVEE